ncbi:MAG: DUF4199 domain-containing protein [Bacteroidetes bacterium]|nr:DUF4199 domain-containing protein [Bacteroidota bacterium]
MEETTQQKPTVLSTSLRYGLILTGISILFFVVQIFTGSNPLEDDWRKWIRMLIGIVMVVLAHQYFKKNGDGYMSYGQGLGIGFLMIMISAVVGAVFTLIYINFVDIGLMDEMWEKALQKAVDRGQNEEQAQMGIDIAKKFFWLIYFVVAAFGSLIIGLIISIFTQKKNPDEFV